MRLTQSIKRASFALVTVGLTTLTAVAADQKVEPNNTAKNQHDRSGDTKTPGDQSNASADLQTTQAIRRGLTKDSNLSNNAKNIKVVTANGQVTLRGPVNSAQEKTTVEQIARSAATGAQVIDQLEIIKPK